MSPSHDGETPLGLTHAIEAEDGNVEVVNAKDAQEETVLAMEAEAEAKAEVKAEAKAEKQEELVAEDCKDSNLDSLAIGDVTPVAVKRKRGRPRKVRVEDAAQIRADDRTERLEAAGDNVEVVNAQDAQEETVTAMEEEAEAEEQEDFVAEDSNLDSLGDLKQVMARRKRGRPRRARVEDEAEDEGSTKENRQMRWQQIRADDRTERHLREANGEILESMKAAQPMQIRFLCHHLSSFAPFLTEPVRQLWQRKAASLSEEEKRCPIPTSLTSQPASICNGTLRSYQLTGLNWLISRHDNGVGGILGDEMVSNHRVSAMRCGGAVV